MQDVKTRTHLARTEVQLPDLAGEGIIAGPRMVSIFSPLPEPSANLIADDKLSYKIFKENVGDVHLLR